MKKRLAVLTFAITVIACGKPAPPEPPVREAIEILYVSAPKLEIHTAPDESSPIIATYNSGETVSVLARKGEWLEVRAPDGSGWTKQSNLTASANATRSTPDEPKFQTQPAPVSNPGAAHGEIVLEGSVNESGQISSIKTLSNTTGSPQLEALTTEQFAKARFYPMMKNGEVIPFVYMYRVEY